MASYGIFADFYDSFMGDRVDESIFVEGLVKKHNPSAKTILELGCGTGTFLKYFSDHGYDVGGIDASEKMLLMAQQKVPRAHLSLQNMSKFSLRGKYDVILCLSDSMNHLLNYEDWKNTFSCVYRHLDGKGIFIFDINTRKKLKGLDRSGPITKVFDEGKVTMNVAKEGEIYNWDIEITKGNENGKTVVKSEVIRERSFSIAEIEKVLKKMFKETTVLERNGGRASENSDRVYFICAEPVR